MDIAREARFAYWNALLTVNGVLVTVFSALAFLGVSNKWFVLIIVCAGVLSAALLISNFKSMKQAYDYLGRLDLSEFGEMTDEQRKADIEQAKKKHESIERNERVVQILLFVEGFMIFVLFFL